MRPLAPAIAVSILLHLLLFAPWFFLSHLHRGPLEGGGGRGSVIVEIVGDEGARDSQRAYPASVGQQVRSAPRRERRSTKGSVMSEGLGTGGGGPGIGSGPSGGSDPTLAKIRARIERAKRYPLIATKSAMEGTPHVRFEIDPQGQPISVTLKSSSGFPVLDEEALETVRRAAPFPAYAKPLEVGIRFEIGK